MNWGLGDRVLDFALIVAVGTGALSGAAWLAAWRLPRRPATRHLILVSALFCCLGVPPLALLFNQAGWTLIAVPLWPAPPSRNHSIPTHSTNHHWRDANEWRSTGLKRPLALEPGAAPKISSRVPGPGQSGPEGPRPPSAEKMRPKASGSAAGPSGALAPALGARGALGPAIAFVLLAWGCGSILMLLNLARNCWRVRRLCRAPAAPVAEWLEELARETGRMLGVRKQPRTIVSPMAVAPFAAAFGRTVVVLPQRLIEEAGRDELRDVLTHEMVHILRRDHLIVFLQELARALYWPIATVHGMVRELGQAREELCDNHVLRFRDAVSYGETLLHLAELALGARPRGATVGILHWKGALERRIAGLLDPRRSTMTKSSRGMACCVALAFLGGGTVVAATRFIASGPAGKPAPAARRAPAAHQADAKITLKKAAADEKPKPPAKKSIVIHAIGPDGKPMAGVNIHRSVWTRKPVNDRGLSRTTNEKGEVRFDVPETLYIFRLFVTAKGHVPMFAGWEEKEDPERSLPAEFTFHLKKGTVIGGTVRDEDGKPITGVNVEVRYESGGETDGRAGPLTWLATTGDGNARTTDAAGRWSLDNVPAGDKVKVRLLLSHPEHISDQHWGDLQEAQGITMQALRAQTAAITMKRGVSATGTVTKPDGQPVAGAVVVRGEHPYWEWGSQEVRTDAHGVYRLPAQPSGPLMITVVAPNWMPAQQKVELRPKMKPVDFRLAPGKRIRVRFVDRLGGPIANVTVQIHRWRGNEALYNYDHPNVINTQIPGQSDKDGIYQWDWAPDDAVTYTFWKEGYAPREIALTADNPEPTITLQKALRITGRVTSAANGQPIAHITAMPVIEFASSPLIAERRDAKKFSDGAYVLDKLDRTDVAYRVRVEAEGYRSAMSRAVRVGAFRPVLDFRLEPAPALKGRVLDAQGNPVAGARAYLATGSQRLNVRSQDEEYWSSDTQKTVTNDRGEFRFPAQFERYAILVPHDSGYAEVSREPDQQPGDLTLRAWARVEGQLVEAGRPVPLVRVSLSPLRSLRGSEPQIMDGFIVKTDRTGHFIFPRVPPVKAFVYSPGWKEPGPPIHSSRSVPLDIRPGQHIELDLGGAGATVTGRVVPTGDLATVFYIDKSLAYLVRRAPGIEPPPEIQAVGFDARKGWNSAWTGTLEGQEYLDTLDHHLVTLGLDGGFRISGVPAGDYDFAIALHGPPKDGCLANPVGMRIVRVRVGESKAQKGTLDLGVIAVPVRAGLQVGETAPELEFTDLNGKVVKLSDLRGRYVLIDFWATWCSVCVDALPAVRKLQESQAGRRLVLLGLVLDENRDRARRFLQGQKLSWAQGLLGDGRADDSVLTDYGVRSAPAFFLIGPDGKLVRSSQNLEEIGAALRQLPR